MGVILGKDITIAVELPSGETLTMKPGAAPDYVDVPLVRQYAGPRTWETNFRGFGAVTVLSVIPIDVRAITANDPIEYLTEQFRGLLHPADLRDKLDATEIKATKLAEWRCSYCGAIMSREARRCEGCNAWRSVVYDD